MCVRPTSSSITGIRSMAERRKPHWTLRLAHLFLRRSRDSSGRWTFLSSALITMVLVACSGPAAVDEATNQNPPLVSGPPTMYYNSSEPGCGTDPTIVLCDDFESGFW